MNEVDPIEKYIAAAQRARQAGVDTAPMALATADEEGRPAVRIVLLRGVDMRGFVFFTNYNSRKARDLAENPRAALCQHWPSLEEQIRIEGTTHKVALEESDAYFAGRPRESQLGAWASEQSAEIAGRDALDARYRQIEARFAGGAVARPPFWGGIRVVPERIEFWYGRPGRMHERVLYVREHGAWTQRYLQP